MLQRRSVDIVISPENIVAEPLTHADYEAIKAALPSWRYILFAKALRGTGLRISELLSLTPDRIKANGADVFILIQRGKKRIQRGGKVDYERLWEKVYLPPLLAAELGAYVEGMKIPPGQRIWTFDRIYFWRIFSAASVKALGRKIHPHELRGLYIKSLLDGGLPVAAAAKMVGHASSKTTERWYYELTADQRAEIQRRMLV